MYDTGVYGVGTAGGAGCGIGVAENFGRPGGPGGWEGGEAGFQALTGAGLKKGAGAGVKLAGGGEITLESVKRSPSVVADRGAMTLVARVGADMGVGVENRLTSKTRPVLTGICLGEVNELPTIVVV